MKETGERGRQSEQGETQGNGTPGGGLSEKQKIDYWNIIQVGMEKTWEMRITPEIAILYADPVEDYNPWYEAWPEGPGQSPFGTAIAPPLLLSHWCGRLRFTDEDTGGMFIFASHNSRVIEPCFIGTLCRFHGKVTKKYLKREKRCYQREVTVTDAETGKLLFVETRENVIV